MANRVSIGGKDVARAVDKSSQGVMKSSVLERSAGLSRLKSYQGPCNNIRMMIAKLLFT